MLERWSHSAALPLRIVLGGWFVVLGLQKLAGYFGGPGLGKTAELMVSGGLTPGTFWGVGRGVARAARRRGGRPRPAHAVGGTGSGARVARSHRRRWPSDERRVPAGGARCVRRAGPPRAAAMRAGPGVAEARVVVASRRHTRTGVEGRLTVARRRSIARKAAGRG